METLEALYQAWTELKVEHAAALAHLAQERERLDQQGAFVVGAVRAASGEHAPDPGTEALVKQGLAGFAREAEAQLAAAREALERQAAEDAAGFERAFQTLREQITACARRYLDRTRPQLTLLLRRVGSERSILHVAKVTEDEAVLLLYLLSGKIPSRYGFLFDDSTEDVALPPPPLYAEEGVAPEQTRPDGRGLLERVRAPGEVLPAKGFVPALVLRPDGGEDFFRLLQRGPVMEVEVLDGAAFRNVLTREESERLAGHLLRMKLERKLELEIRPE